jgi:Nucleoside 2-deoxyribosyltransferase like
VKYIEAPEVPPDNNPKGYLFLAGGITNCPDWQSDMVSMLADTKLKLLNPRRKNFPINDPMAAYDQIKWEYAGLRFAEKILFWFPSETLCPIVLYELGAWSMTNKPIYIGMHPDYQRRQDVEIQTSLTRPEVKIVYSLPDLASQIRNSL